MDSNIEENEVSIAKVGRSIKDSIVPHSEGWCAHIEGEYTYYAEKPLLAAMRSFVAKSLGFEIEIPLTYAEENLNIKNETSRKSGMSF